MPTYQYECPGDGESKDYQLPYDHESPLCDTCYAPMIRVYTAPAVKFNAPGFYSTGG